jgi:signal transduction histidine kinase/ActR/RegA family two-component response regulator
MYTGAVELAEEREKNMTEKKTFGIKANRDADIGYSVVRIELDESGTPVDWLYLDVNETLAKMEGLTVEQMIGHRFYELFPDRDRSRLWPHYKVAYEGGTASFDDISEEIDRYVHIDVYPVAQKGCCICILRDMKDDIAYEEQREHELENRVEEAIRLASEHREIVDTVARLYTTALLENLTTHDYKMIKGTPFVHKILNGGGNVDDRMDDVLENFVHPDMRSEMAEFLKLDTVADRLADKASISLDFKDKTGHWFVCRFLPFRWDEDGRATEVLYLARDITWEKEKEFRYIEQMQEALGEAERANVSKTNFLRRMSHDIRTPLNGIIGMLKIMDDNEGDQAKYREYMDKINRSAEYLLSIINNVLDIGKMETGEIELEHRPFDLMQLLTNTLPVIATNASQHSVVFIGSEDDIHLKHKYVIGSPVHLNRVLMNIASNAVKYNRSGGYMKIRGNELKSDGKQATYEFICEDSGLGMSEEFQKHAFEPYTREGKESKTSFSGSGLGLSIVKKIVDKMGGTVELTSKEGVGTTIRVVLSFTIDPNPEAIHEKGDELIELDLSGRRALLVEDNEINMEIAKVILEGLGLAVTGVKNGREAVETFQREEEYTFDFIFMDMMMPVMDGLEATRTIRELPKLDAKSVPIIAMTANAFAEDRRACLEAGMNEHVSKPIDTKELNRVLRKFI